tara:strand:- start:110 stop:265 length:156 start_codon:yes stop_codon:yes gene_type:complete
MVVRCELMAIDVVGEDMEAYERHTARAEDFRNLKGFDEKEYNLLAKFYKTD